MGRGSDDFDVGALWLGWAIMAAIMCLFYAVAWIAEPDAAPVTPTPDPYRPSIIATPVTYVAPTFVPVERPDLGAFYLPCDPWGMFGRVRYAGRLIAGCEQSTCTGMDCKGMQ